MSESDWVTGKVGLRIGNVPLDLEMTVPARPIRPHRMLPIFHQMADSFADIGVQIDAEAGRSVSCQAGCTACCYQAVPVSEIEIYYIAELVSALPEPRRSEIRRRFAESLKHFRDIGWFDDLHSRKAGSLKGAEALVLKYYHERIPCPFLEDSMCSIYEQRPVGCREFLVTSPAENCSNPTAESVRAVGLPVKPSSAIKAMAARDAVKREGFLLLTMALEIAEKYPEDFPEKTGEQWMADFFGRLTDEPAPYTDQRTTPVKSVANRRKRPRAKR
ncbi:MAG: YkgJ family cysteine cluster protein [Pyrinomonadaceae bacterium]